jgi:hypothetical protein
VQHTFTMRIELATRADRVVFGVNQDNGLQIIA